MTKTSSLQFFCRIFTLIILQMQVILVAIPIVIILRGSSTDGRYMGIVLLIFTFPATTVTFIMGPKFLAYFHNDLSVSGRTSASRQSRAASNDGVRVSGISGLSGATASDGRQGNSEMESAFVARDGARKVSFAVVTDSKDAFADEERSSNVLGR